MFFNLFTLLLNSKQIILFDILKLNIFIPDSIENSAAHSKSDCLFINVFSLLFI